jgi:hypothetical protein
MTIREFRDKFSQYLKEMQEGKEIIVNDWILSARPLEVKPAVKTEEEKKPEPAEVKEEPKERKLNDWMTGTPTEKLRKLEAYYASKGFKDPTKEKGWVNPFPNFMDGSVDTLVKSDKETAKIIAKQIMGK